MNTTRLSILYSLVILLISCCKDMSAAPAPADECKIMRLPSIAYKKGDVYFIEQETDKLQLTLECRCTLYTPKWEQYTMSTRSRDNPTDPMQCLKNEKNCSPTSYISKTNQADGFYLYQVSTFEITEHTILSCSSFREREVVIVSIKAPAVVAEVSVASSSSSTISPSQAVVSSSSSTTTVTATPSSVESSQEHEQ